MSEQDKGPDVQTRRREAEGLGLNSTTGLLVGLVGEEASMSMVRRGARL